MSSVLTPRVSGRTARGGGVTMYLGPVDTHTESKARTRAKTKPSRLPGLAAEFSRHPNRERLKSFLHKHGIRAPVLSDGRYRIESSDLDIMAESRVVSRLGTQGADSRQSPQKYYPSPVPSLKPRGPQASPVSYIPQQGQGLTSARIKPYTTLDFTKLKQYDWIAAKAPHGPRNLATDRMYTNTYQTECDKNSTPYIETPRVSNKTVYRTEDQTEQPSSPPNRPVSTQIINPRTRGNGNVASRRPSMPSDRLEELDGMENILDIKAVASRDKSGNGMLFSAVKHSIDTLQMTQEKMGLHKLRFIDRPLKKEQGRYRPVSKTSIKTPENSSSNGSPYRDFKSAEAYIKYLDSLKEIPSPAQSGFRARANTRMSTSASRYLESHLSNKLLQSVVDFNRPGESPPRTPKPRENITRGSQKYGKQRPRTGASLQEAASADLLIEPLQVPPPRTLGDMVPSTIPSDWALRDFYDQPQLDDYRPPSVSSNKSANGWQKEMLLVDVPQQDDME